MKNRDNEFFIEENLDELVEAGDKNALRDQLCRILACPCCLNGFKKCRKYLQIFTDEEITGTPYLATAAAVISAIYGNLEQAERYAACVENEPLMKLHLDVMIPGTDEKRVIRALEKLFHMQQKHDVLPNLPLAAGRLTLINGFRDFTVYGDWVLEHKEQLKEYMTCFYGDSAVGMAEIVYAEVCYQRNDCFAAITTLVGSIPFIEKKGEIAVLFVDDNPLLLRTMKALISDNYKVSIAVSGAQAMEIMQKDCPDMIFLDYEMPLINGKMVLRVIRSNQRYEKLPVVILSAVSDREYIEELLKLKPDGYLLKPARQDQILEMIDKCLG